MTIEMKRIFLSAFGIFLLILISSLAFGDKKNKVLIHKNCHIAIQKDDTNNHIYRNFNKAMAHKYTSFELVMKALVDLGYHPYRYSKSSRPKEGLYLRWTYYPDDSGGSSVDLLKLNPDENTIILASVSTSVNYLATKIYQSFPRCNAEHLVNYFVDGNTFEIVLNLLNELLSYNNPNLIKRLEKIINVDARELTYNRIYEIVKDLSRVFILAFRDKEKNKSKNNKVLIHENCRIAIQKEITEYKSLMNQ